jgi:hypothetical protein
MIPLTGPNGQLHPSFYGLPEHPDNPRSSGAHLVPGWSYELTAAPSGAFYTLDVSPADYGREFGVRVSGTGTITLQCSDPSFSFLLNNGSTGPSLVLSAGIAAIEYRILASRVVRPMRGYVLGAAAPVDPGDGDGDPGPSGTYDMIIGSQGWFVTQAAAAQYGDDSETWSGDHVFQTQPPIEWSTAYGSPSTPGALSAVNPWRTRTLELWASLNGPARFMDFSSTNHNPMIHWADRVLPTESQYEFYSAPDSMGDPPTDRSVRGMAVEWMCDLCNRTGRDFWVTIPHLFTDAAITSLAQLIKARLDPALKVYVEYSNETWNFGSGTLEITGSTYTGGNHRAQADHVIMQGVDGGYPGSNAYYRGYAFHCARSFACWYLFAQVFAGDTARLINVVSCNGNMDLLREGLQNTYNSATYNPHDMQVHLIATAPYIEGHSSAAWQASVNEALAPGGNCYEAKEMAETYSAEWGCYEGGQQAAASGADVWAQDPAIYSAYLYLLNKLGEAGCSVFCHYTLVARSSSSSAWGLLSDSYESIADAHKYRAVLDWIAEQTT